MPLTLTTPRRPYTRDQLAQYEVADRHTVVVEWISDDQQSSLVVGLGATLEEAESDALASASRGEYEIDGGSLHAHLIAEN